ncbi:50S ribosomal protein L3 [Candidatus Vidania fulgoroideorum]
MIEVTKLKMKSIYYKGNIIPVTVLKIKKKINFDIKKKILLISKSKGKGFSGTIKKFNFSSNYKTHGNSKAHRKPGSIGMCQDPGRVFKNKKMPGRMGSNKIKLKNIKIFYYNNLEFYVKGPLAGANKSKVLIYDN